MTLLSFYVEVLPNTVVGFIFVVLAIGAINHLLFKRLDGFPPAETFPRVSILVPARNEAHNIEACLRSLLAQQYPGFEVLVLDDHSTDGTPAILERLSRQDARLRVLSARPLPEGWLGKHWACHQLAQAATGDLILFTDADTRHEPLALRDGVSALMSEVADMLTIIPLERVETWGVRLTVPAIGFFICCFLPLALAQQIRRPSLALAIGQFMLFRRPALEAIGGYESVRAEVVDDVALARRIVRLGHRWRIMDGTNRVSCRMYRGFWEAVEGFTKNIFAYFNHHVLLYILVWTWVEVAFALPPLVLLAGELGRPLEFFPQRQALIATSASLLCWLIAYRRFRFPLVLVVLYPITITLFVLIAFRSMVYNLTGQAQWKDRALSPPLWRW